MILGLCPKPRRSALAILEADPHALRYRLLATAFWAKICSRKHSSYGLYLHLRSQDTGPAKAPFSHIGKEYLYNQRDLRPP